MQDSRKPRSVAIVGGGLAGLAAAARLAEHGYHVTLFEARRQLGGRAGSYHDPATGELVDHCQHVGMGCCTNFTDFCRRTGIEGLLRRDCVLHFLGHDGKCHRLQASRWLPAPLHLLPSLLRLGYLTWSERLGIIRALLQLARTTTENDVHGPTIGHWLRDRKQSQQAIERFWSVVLVSALGEVLDNTSLAAARKVFVDGFMAHRDAYQIHVPTVSLGTLYGQHVADYLNSQGVLIHLGESVSQLLGDARIVTGLQSVTGTKYEFDFVVVAAPWRRVAEMIPAEMAAVIPEIQTLEQIASSPITSVHLWFDRPITSLPHAVFIDRLSQWVFNHGQRSVTGQQDCMGYYYQVVISASRQLEHRPRSEILGRVRSDLEANWPAALDAKLIQWRIVNQHDAVFSVRRGLDRLRPSQTTNIANLMLAGDWTRTGWPATMEGAVRSGYLAAESILRDTGRDVCLLAPDLPRGWLARRVIGHSAP